MIHIKDPTEFRIKIQKVIASLMTTTIYSVNIEKGILNYTIRVCSENYIVKKWENSYFVQIYIDRFRTIYRNLQNTSFRERVETGEYTPMQISHMTHQEFLPEKWKQLIEFKKIKDETLYAPHNGNTDMFVCRKCKSNNCSYYQLQTRSADEPMTTFVTCVSCGNRWKC